MGHHEQSFRVVTPSSLIDREIKDKGPIRQARIDNALIQDYKQDEYEDYANPPYYIDAPYEDGISNQRYSKDYQNYPNYQNTDYNYYEQQLPDHIVMRK